MFHVNKGIVQVINPLHLLRFVPSSLCPVASAAVMPRASRAGSNGGINSALTQQGTTLGGFSSELAWGSPWCRVVQSRARGGCVSRDPHPSMGGPILAPSAPFPRTFSTPSKIIAPKNFKPQTQRPCLRASGCNNTRSILSSGLSAAVIPPGISRVALIMLVPFFQPSLSLSSSKLGAGARHRCCFSEAPLFSLLRY